MIRVDEAWGVLSRDIEVRLLNVSASGCLIESPQGHEGASGSLTVHLDGAEYVDAVVVTRCHALQGAGSTFRMGAEFLLVTPPRKRSLRRIARTLEQGRT
jgi:hypothetical protein